MRPQIEDEHVTELITLNLNPKAEYDPVIMRKGRAWP